MALSEELNLTVAAQGVQQLLDKAADGGRVSIPEGRLRDYRNRPDAARMFRSLSASAAPCVRASGASPAVRDGRVRGSWEIQPRGGAGHLSLERLEAGARGSRCLGSATHRLLAQVLLGAKGQVLRFVGLGSCCGVHAC